MLYVLRTLAAFLVWWIVIIPLMTVGALLALSTAGVEAADRWAMSYAGDWVAVHLTVLPFVLLLGLIYPLMFRQRSDAIGGH
jgi:hypothetical protein